MLTNVPRALRAALLSAVVPLLFAGPARSEEEPVPEPAAEKHVPWVLNVADAKAQAAREKKHLYILFTGSDWCGWCKRLDAEVFMKTAFVDAAVKQFVFLYLDFPNSEEAKAKVVDADLNAKLGEQYQVGGYPTAVLALPDGMPYAKTGYKKGGPESYAQHLDELHAAGDKVAALLAPKGRDDVKKLKAGMETLSEQELLCYPDYAWMLDLAEKKDADGKLGLKAIAQKERERRLAEADEKALNELLAGVQRKEDIPFAKVHEFLKGAKHLRGIALVKMSEFVGEWLVAEKRPAEAKALYERALKDPICAERPELKDLLTQAIEKADEAMKEGDSGEMGR